MGATAAFTYLFLRELVPSSRLAAPLGGIAVAFQPVAAFVSGGVNPDSLLWAASAALFWLIARAFRRGLTLRLAIAMGAAMAVALLTKGAAFGLVPGALLAVVILAWRQRALIRRGDGRRPSPRCPSSLGC